MSKWIPVVVAFTLLFAVSSLGQPSKAASIDEKDFSIIPVSDWMSESDASSIALALEEELVESFRSYLTVSHFPFIYGCKQGTACMNNINFEVKFKIGKRDLGGTDTPELLVTLIAPNMCGSGGCSTYILSKRKRWEAIGSLLGATDIASRDRANANNRQYADLLVTSRDQKYLCKYVSGQYKCEN